MSTFHPLNLVEDQAAKKDLEDEHTRELQVEQAYDLFQQALRLQTEKQWTQAYQVYEKIMSIDIIANHFYEESNHLLGIQNGSFNSLADGLQQLAPNVKNLRYLIFRNRGILLFSMLELELAKDNLNTLEDEKDDTNISAWEKNTKSMFYTMMDDFSIALLYNEADETLLEMLHQILDGIGMQRMARFTLEYSVSGNKESDDPLYGLLPPDSQSKQRLSELISRLNFKSKNVHEIASPLKQIPFLTKVKSEFKTQQRQQELKTNLEIILSNEKENLYWSDIFMSLDTAVGDLRDENKCEDHQKLKLRYLDPYQLTEDSIETISFTLKDQNILSSISNSDVVDKAVTVSADDKASKDSDLPKEDSLEISEKADNEVTISNKEIDVQKQQVDDFENENDQNCKVTETENVNGTAVAPKANTPTNDKTNVSNTSDTKQQIHRASKRLARLESEPSFPSGPVQQSNFAGLDYFVSQLKASTGVLETDEISLFYFGKQVFKEQYKNDFLKIVTDWQNMYLKAFTAFGNQKGKSSADNLKLLDLLTSFSDNGKDEAKGVKLPLLDEWENGETIISTLSGKKMDYFDLRINILKHFLVDSQGHLLLNCFWGKEIAKYIREWVLHLETFLFSSLKLNIADLTLAVGVVELLTDYEITLQSQIKGAFKQKKKMNKTVINGLSQEMLTLKTIISKWSIYVKSLIRKLSKDEHNDNDDDDHDNDDDKLSNEILLLRARFQWCLIHKNKATATAQNDDLLVLTSLKELLNSSQEHNLNLNIQFPNYVNIPALTTESLRTQIIVVSVLQLFSQILFGDTSNDNANATRLLEDILMDTGCEQTEAIVSIKKFLSTNSIDLSLSLWNVLLQFYTLKEQLRKLSKDLVVGFKESLRILDVYLTSERYSSGTDAFRYETLCKVLGFCNNSLRLLIQLLEKNSWRLEESIPFDMLELLFQISLLFEIHEEACSMSSYYTSIKSVSPTSYNELKDMFLRVSVLIIANIRQELSTEVLHSSIKLFHAQLGASGICDSTGGIFLKASQEYLSEPTSASDSVGHDIVQIIKCRYHYNIGLEDFTPYDHETQAKEGLLFDGCQELAKYVLPLCFKKSTIQNVPRQDMKVLIEEMYDVIGDPDVEADPILSRNKAIFDHFLDATQLKSSIFRDAFHGLMRLGLDKKLLSLSLTSNYINSSLYYLQGLLVFTAYKLRKKNMQGRAVEIEKAISLFTYDLVCGSDRVESWYLMAQAYGYLVEDDLIWTSDKLTVFDRKVGTANLQRKSILCYLMAVNGTLDESVRETIKPIVGGMMATFATALYGCISKPMDMLAFRVQSQPRFVNLDSSQSRSGGLSISHSSNATSANTNNNTNSSSTSTSTSTSTSISSNTSANTSTSANTCFITANEKPAVSQMFCYKLIQQAFQLALKSDKNWVYYYKLSKVQRKFGYTSATVLKTMIRACEEASRVKLAESVIEPHYCLVSLCLKYVERNELTPQKAVSYLQASSLVKFESSSVLGDNQGKHNFNNGKTVDKDDNNGQKQRNTHINKDKLSDVDNDNDANNDTPREAFFKIIVSALKQIDAADKKNWQHRPKYRLSRVLYEHFNDLEGALDTLSDFISLKSTNKQLVLIWKPEFERPGKHFLYTNQYVQYFIQLLNKKQDLNSLVVMMPKLRRSSSIMVNLSLVWEILCSSICKIIRKSLNVGDSFVYTDNFINNLPYIAFHTTGKYILEQFQNEGMPNSTKPHLFYLHALNEMRKLNNGYGPTSLVDDTIVTVYFKIYEHYDKHQVPDTLQSPNSKRKTAKKDVFPVVNDMLKIIRRDLDDEMKEVPDIYNVLLEKLTLIYEKKNNDAVQPSDAITNTLKDAGKNTLATSDKLEIERVDNLRNLTNNEALTKSTIGDIEGNAKETTNGQQVNEQSIQAHGGCNNQNESRQSETSNEIKEASDKDGDCNSEIDANIESSEPNEQKKNERLQSIDDFKTIKVDGKDSLQQKRAAEEPLERPAIRTSAVETGKVDCAITNNNLNTTTTTTTTTNKEDHDKRQRK